MTGLVPLALGLGLDLVLGDPPGWPHPVRWLGRLVAWAQRLILARCEAPRAQRMAGAVLAVGLPGLAGGLAWLALAGLGALWPPLAWLAGGWLVWTCLALKDLVGHVRPIAVALAAGDLDQARRSLSLVVGRETAALDETGVARAGLETLAENLSDGVIAPLFFIILGGPAAGLAYKAVNTLDSMVGYKHAPFTHLGRWSAKLDDLVNYFPARLSAGLIILGAALTGLRPGRATRVALSAHGLSSSPNAGWPEAALAGALDVSLLGPAVYAGQKIDKPFLNAAARPPELADLRSGLRLGWVTGLLAYGLGLGVAVWRGLG